MPRTNLPSYRLHKPSGQAIVSLNGKMHYLGPYKSKESRAKYNELIARYAAAVDSPKPPTRTQKEITIADLAAKFLEWAESHYLDYDGKPNSTANHCRLAVAPLIEHYGENPVSDFAPTSLMFLQQKWEKAGRHRPTVNRWTRMVKQAFKHGVKLGLVSVEIWQALTAVDNLKAGRTTAPENNEIEPVDDSVVEKTLPHVSPIVADMIRVQRLIGGRPQDVYNMRVCDIDRSGDVWVYQPFKHKTKHKGKDRALAIGPKAQAILIPYLARKTGDDYIFSPKESMAMFREAQRKNRKTKVQPSQQDRSKRKPKRAPGEHYTKDSYNRAVHVACERAGVPKWSPNQLRHTAATEIRKNYGLEAAQVALGHLHAKTTEIYAEKNFELAAQVAREIG